MRVRVEASRDKYEIERCWFLSTAHLPGPAADFYPCVHIEHEDGWIVFIVPQCDLNTISVEDRDMADWFKPIYSRASRLGIGMISFGPDNPTHSHFTVFDW